MCSEHKIVGRFAPRNYEDFAETWRNIVSVIVVCGEKFVKLNRYLYGRECFIIFAVASHWEAWIEIRQNSKYSHGHRSLPTGKRGLK